MPTLKIKGSVKYADLLPAENVRVKITDLDLGPNGGSDLIFDKMTTTDGKFSGTSLEWKDEEGHFASPQLPHIPFLPAPPHIPDVVIPDVLNLEFKVEDGTQYHKGPFVRIGDDSAPIILPPTFKKPVEKNDRELILIVHLLTANYTEALEIALYGFIENGSTAAVDNTLGGEYSRVHHLHGPTATLSHLKATLRAAGERAGTKAIDLVFCTHGQTAAVVFSDGNKSVDQVLAALDDLPPSTRNKFRMVFSTACFGTTHAAKWQEAGFDCISGSEKVYADSEFTLIPFLLSWKAGKSFGEAVNTANTVAGNTGDNVAKEYYRQRSSRAADQAEAIRFFNMAQEINSHRIVTGNGKLRIYSKPA